MCKHTHTLSLTHTHHRSYMEYFNFLRIGTMPDTSLFWTQTLELVDMLSIMGSGARVMSSANEPSTAILNNIEHSIGNMLRWCGTTNSTSEGMADGISQRHSSPYSDSWLFHAILCFRLCIIQK